MSARTITEFRGSAALPGEFAAAAGKSAGTFLIRLQGEELWKNRADLSPMEIRAMSGTVWVTNSGDPEDHILHAGEKCALSAGATALVSALSAAATVEVERDLRLSA